MAEFGNYQHPQQSNLQHHSHPPPSMHWYEASTSQQVPVAPSGMMSSFPSNQYAPPTAYNSSNFDDEPPLLEELGIDVSMILRRTRCMLTGRLTPDVLKDLDLGGPLMLAAALGFLHLLMGKLHFGVILGWTIVASIAISWVASMIAGPSVRSVDIYSCSCLLGYCMMPMLGYSLLALFIRRGSLLGVVGLLSSGWCARLAATVFGVLASDMKEHFWLLFYPCLLYYGSIALISVY